MTYTNELYHHGVKGMRWGVRRYQNEDGSLTEAGVKRQQRKERREARRAEKLSNFKTAAKARADRKLYDKKIRRLEKKVANAPKGSWRARRARRQLRRVKYEQQQTHKRFDRMTNRDMHFHMAGEAGLKAYRAYNGLKLASLVVPPLMLAGRMAIAKAQANAKILDVPYEVVYDDSWTKQLPSVSR